MSWTLRIAATSIVRSRRLCTAVDKAAWDTDEMRRLAIERLWTVAGNVAEAYRKAAELPPGVDPWAELYGFRSVLAHALPGDIASDRVWHETVVDLPRLLEQVQAARR
jgi:uncharacterized protein with HEPN domain